MLQPSQFTVYCADRDAQFFFMNFLHEIESQISRRFFRTVKSLFFGPFSYFFVVFFGVIFQVVIQPSTAVSVDIPNLP